MQEFASSVIINLIRIRIFIFRGSGEYEVKKVNAINNQLKRKDSMIRSKDFHYLQKILITPVMDKKFVQTQK